MRKNLLYIIGCLFLFWGIYSCNDTNAGLIGMPGEIIEDIDPSDTIPENPEGPGEEEVFGDPHIVEMVEMPEGYWPIVRNWPGVPGDTSVEKRWANVKVTIDAVYTKRHPDDRFGGIGTTPWFSTGLYAAPAEVITIVKPQSLRGKRIVCRIGASNCTLGEKQKPWKRLPKTFITEVLNDDTTRLYNYCGGNIYIVPDQPFEKPEVFIITGAIKSPDFVLGKTDARKWLEEISKTTVPFAEIAGKRVIWTMPTGEGYLRSVVDPVALMEFYDDAIVNDFFAFHGISESSFDLLHRAPNYPARQVPDIQVCAGAAHAGYPCMYGMNYASRGVQLELMKTTNNAWGFYHEVGHNYQVYCWKWSDGPGSIGEVSNNFHIMHSRTRLFNKWHEGTNVYQSKIDAFMADAVAMRDFESSDETKVDGTTRLIPFCQLAQQYGWKLFAYLGKKSRELTNDVANVLGASAAEARKDFFCISVCEYAGVDLREFFDAWGIKYTTRASGRMARLPRYSEYKFWEKWEENIIPSIKAQRTPVLIDDFGYGMPEGEIVRKNWLIVEDECQHAFSTTPISNILDGVNSTYWASETVTRPVYDIKPVIVIDMVASNYIDYFEYLHRQDNKHILLKCKKLRIEVKDYYGDDWTLVKDHNGNSEFTLENVDTFQMHDFDRPYQAQYIRLTFLEGMDSGASGSVCLSEFKVGKNAQ